MRRQLGPVPFLCRIRLHRWQRWRHTVFATGKVWTGRSCLRCGLETNR